MPAASASSASVPFALAPGRPVPAAAAWLGLLGTGLAAVAGGLSSQAHGLAAPDLGGALGLSADEASWITTAGSMAEGAAVLAASALAAAFGPRRVVVAACLATGLCAGLALRCEDSSALIALRGAEGFATGLLPVVMMGWAMRAFPPPARGLPLMLFAAASSVPSAFAASAAGAMTGTFGGRGAFLLDLAWAPAVLVVALLLVPAEPASPRSLLRADWLGYALLASATMLILAVLTQGERRFWLDAEWIADATAASLVLGSLAVAWMLVAPSPLLDLSLLLKGTFAVAIAEAFSLRFALLLTSFALPQALARLQGFRTEQAGAAILWLAAGQAIGFPLAYSWNRRRDPRWSLGLGLALFAAAAFVAATIDPTLAGRQFVPALVLAGAAQGLYLTGVVTFATWNVPREAGATAAGLFNLVRVLGTAASTGAVGYFLRIRENGHSARLVEGLVDGSPASRELARLTGSYAGFTPDAPAAAAKALGALATEGTTQAYALAFADVFLAIAAILAVFALLVPALPRLDAFKSPAQVQP